MNIADLVARTGKPRIYEKGTAFMWTDPHISKQLLDIHLNPDLDLASRKRSTIESTAAWILETQEGKGKLNILDLVTLIYTDLGVLLPPERELLLGKVFQALKKGGTFIFDVLSDKEIEKKTSPKTWEASNSGFWRGSPYLTLSESFLYPEEKVILFQHSVVDADDTMETYRFWTHFFSQGDLAGMLENHNFTEISFRDNVLPRGDLFSGDHVIFVRASK